MAAAFDFETLTLGEVATIEDLSGTAISAVTNETPQGKFLAALTMVVKRRTGEPGFKFNDALAMPMKEAQTFLGLDDVDDDEDDDDADDAGKDVTFDGSAIG
mgnify:CR=1 FL=1